MTRKSSFFLIPLVFSALVSCKGRDVESTTVQDESAGLPTDCVSSAAQTKLSGSEVFDLTSKCVFDRQVHSFRIRILSETFSKVLDDGCAGRDSGYGHVIEMVLDGVSLKDVGIKVRGNSSRCNPKRQFKFKFDAKETFSVFNAATEIKKFPENKDRTLFGLAGISLRSSANDPSMIRERVSSLVFNRQESLKATAARGGLVYRVAFTKFWVSFNRNESEGPEGTFKQLIDGFYYDYKGFYSLAENIDKVFLASRFQNGSDKLKNFYLYQADLARAEFSKANFRRDGWGVEFVDGKSADDEAAFAAADSKLFSLFGLLDSGASDQDLAKQIDIENIVNYTAGAILTGHWDSLLANKNNDLLYFNGATKKWQLIAWDLDNSQGVLRDQYKDLMSDDIFNPATRHKSKLFTEIFSKNRGFRPLLKARLAQSLDGFYAAGKFNQDIDNFEQSVKANIEDWEGYNHQSFEDIKSFANARRDKIKPQL